MNRSTTPRMARKATPASHVESPALETGLKEEGSPASIKAILQLQRTRWHRYAIGGDQ